MIEARDTTISQRGDKDPLASALTALAAYMDHVWETERATPGAAFKAITNDSLEWFMTDEADTEYRRAFNHKKVADAIAFGRSLVTGHAFMARYQQATKGGRFISYKLDLPRIAGSVLLDASSDIDGVTALSPWRALVVPPKVSFANLSIKHLPFPIVDPEGSRKTVTEITSSATLANNYADWIKRTIIAETQPGEWIAAVTHRAMIDQGRVPNKRTFEDPWAIEGDRKVAFLTYGRGIGANSHKRATSVFLFGMFWRPQRVSAGQLLGFIDKPAREANLGELSNPNTRHELMTTIANGDLLRWAKQLSTRGNARNFDDNGVCGRMKLVVVGELDLWLKSHARLFPNASFEVSEESKTAAPITQAMAAFILEHPEGFTSRQLCEATGAIPNHLARLRKASVVIAAMDTAGLEFVPGGGRGKPAQWLPKAVKLAA